MPDTDNLIEIRRQLTAIEVALAEQGAKVEGVREDLAAMAADLRTASQPRPTLTEWLTANWPTIAGGCALALMTIATVLDATQGDVDAAELARTLAPLLLQP